MHSRCGSHFENNDFPPKTLRPVQPIPGWLAQCNSALNRSRQTEPTSPSHVIRPSSPMFSAAISRIKQLHQNNNVVYVCPSYKAILGATEWFGCRYLTDTLQYLTARKKNILSFINITAFELRKASWLRIFLRLIYLNEPKTGRSKLNCQLATLLGPVLKTVPKTPSFCKLCT